MTLLFPRRKRCSLPARQIFFNLKSLRNVAQMKPTGFDVEMAMLVTDEGRIPLLGSRCNINPVTLLRHYFKVHSKQFLLINTLGHVSTQQSLNENMCWAGAMYRGVGRGGGHKRTSSQLQNGRLRKELGTPGGGVEI